MGELVTVLIFLGQRLKDSTRSTPPALLAESTIKASSEKFDHEERILKLG